jgi:acyl-coenzyme A thioesterase PaaI-like protein
MSEKISKQWLLPERAFGECFGCAPHNTKGLKLRFWYTEEGCVSHHIIPKEYCGFTGLAHGGIIATLLDEVAAWTVITQLFCVGITLQVTVSYIKPVPTEEEIIIKGKIETHEGDRVTTLSTILSKKGTILAEAKSKWLLPDEAILQKITGLDSKVLNQVKSEVINPIRKMQAELHH